MTTADGGPGRGGASGGGLGRRLLVALALVLATAGVTAWLVAGAVGPAIFHEHLGVGGMRTAEDAVAHAEEAFRTASGLALGIALAVAALVALAVSVVLTRRIGASLAALTTAARQVAGGRFAARVPAPDMGREFDELVLAFNQMAARLEESENLRHRLLADVAHEVRTPVATLNAHLEGLEDGVVEAGPETFAVLRAQSARLTRLAEDLAAVTKAESGELALSPVPTDPGELVHLAHLAARERAEAAAIALTADVEPGLPPIAADPERMAQVLGNLVDNALRHTPAGGRVTIAARRDPSRTGTHVTHVTLTVADTGGGIAAEHLPHVFERFYRADTARDRASGGSGIGLAITRALVEAHGGSVGVASAGRGSGATFTVTLPVEPPRRAAR
ncbi:sensor histidine kinase [Actinotalea fermentans]|uniref:histidine kinase n=1 Tax=Actinotalea fermentans TaxID=43671 RepID=A0A511Z1P9_9CELL|nr:ATP-binding protein [Actinotalea fermentans]KGM16482.1 histidine kinase [Actinotalea fermentans ATCC 43279 = JCM 9966 = DSM 3133]GEN81375.1 putative sensor histidine kinase [Actinotalea fermentans]